METIYHRDGTVTYWSVATQSWQERVEAVPDADLASMGNNERERILAHLADA